MAVWFFTGQSESGKDQTTAIAILHWCSCKEQNLPCIGDLSSTQPLTNLFYWTVIWRYQNRIILKQTNAARWNEGISFIVMDYAVRFWTRGAMTIWSVKWVWVDKQRRQCRWKFQKAEKLPGKIAESIKREVELSKISQVADTWR